MISNINRVNRVSNFPDTFNERAVFLSKRKAYSHVVGWGDEGDAADQVRALSQERQLGRDLQGAGGGKDCLGGGDGGVEGGQWKDKASAGARSSTQCDRFKTEERTENAKEE